MALQKSSDKGLHFASMRVEWIFLRTKKQHMYFAYIEDEVLYLWFERVISSSFLKSVIALSIY